MIDLVMIVGPTGVGKTALSLELAKKFNGEIINGDAMQFYKGLDIGTAKVKHQEQENIPHHLLDILEPEVVFSVALYQEMVREKVSEINSRKKLPIIVGGSGLYLSAIIDDYLFLGDKRHNDIESKYQDLSTEKLAKILIETKPLLAKKCDLSNRRRVLRALSKDETAVQEKLNPYYENALIIGLELDRKKLYELLDQRVEEMIQNGLIVEVKSLYDKKINSQAMQAIGYKELYRYFDGEMELSEVIDLIKRNTRRYAKRQLTWFKNKMKVNWFTVNLDNFDSTVNEVIEYIKKEVY
ncbi:MAG: tRNA (adenosine(37)-N6)-dimethylallyltransferase MiaA [Candidatus Izemoplasmatales bacterium]|nr:tRNA (adenosine(37)-N6)-dimethylallyltransferase MiaA [Candidatus Izemoplasmatales bacterium]